VTDTGENEESEDAMTKKYPWMVCVLLLLPVGNLTYASMPDQFAEERGWFMEAHKAFEKGETDEFKRLRTKVGTNYPIAHYLDYLLPAN